MPVGNSVPRLSERVRERHSLYEKRDASEPGGQASPTDPE